MLPFHFLLLVIFLSKKAQAQVFCSAYCTYSESGFTGITPECTDQTPNTCTACDTSLFTHATSTCNPTNSVQYLDMVKFSTSVVGDLPSWTRTGTITDTIRFGVYYIVQIGDDSTMSYTHAATIPHHSARIRFFVIRDDSYTYQLSYTLATTTFSYQRDFWRRREGQIETSSLVAHNQANIDIAFSRSGDSGFGYIGIKQVMLFLSKCTAYCLNCTSTACLLCGLDTSSVQTYLDSTTGTCVYVCPDSYYENVNVCTLCDSKCLLCQGTSVNCSSCMDIGSNRSYLLINTCHLICPSEYIQNGTDQTCRCLQSDGLVEISNVCYRCDVKCALCFGITQFDCTDCVDPYYLIASLNQCTYFCPSGYLTDELNKECIPCNTSKCTQCSVIPTNCTGCIDIFPKAFLSENTCVQNCPLGFYKDSLLFQCLKCPIPQFSYEGSCTSQCPQDYIEDLPSRACVPIQDSNFFYEINLQIQAIDQGKMLKYTLGLNKGLSDKTVQTLSKTGYYNITIIMSYSDTNSSNDETSRLLQTANNLLFEYLQPLRIQVSNNFLIIQSKMPIHAMNAVSFTVEFSEQILRNLDNVKYGNVSSGFIVADNPLFLSKLYLSYSLRNYYNLIGYAFLVICAWIFLYIFTLLWRNLSYHIFVNKLLVQFIQIMQLLGLVAYTKYPMTVQMLYFFKGLNYSNFAFVKNFFKDYWIPASELYSWSGYVIVDGDMNFFRLSGSCLVLIASTLVAIAAFRIFFKISLTFLRALFLNMVWLTQTKIMFSLWSSVIFICLNVSSGNIWLYLGILLGVALAFISIVFRLLSYRANGHFSELLECIWRITVIILIPFLHIAPILITFLILIISFGFCGIQLYQRSSNQSYDLDLNQLTQNKFALKAWSLRIFLKILVVGILIGCTRLIQNNIGIMVTVSVFLLFSLLFVIIANILIAKYFVESKQASSSGTQKDIYQTINEDSKGKIQDSQELNDSQFLNEKVVIHVKNTRKNRFRGVHKNQQINDANKFVFIDDDIQIKDGDLQRKIDGNLN